VLITGFDIVETDHIISCFTIAEKTSMITCSFYINIAILPKHVRMVQNLDVSAIDFNEVFLYICKLTEELDAMSD
jgi:hypothetical protein